MATSAAENTAGYVPTREESSQRDNKNTYWQVGKNVTDCLYSLYEQGLWTDVKIRCKDQQLDDPDDRLCAHKVILAARSPVFSAIFYGSFAENINDIELLEHSKMAVDAFLRYVYHDQTHLETDITHEVLKIGHFYQETGLVDDCCKLLADGLTAENACSVLETALLYNVSSLRKSVLDFIDMNAEAVLKSDGFLEISKDTLAYLIKGDTLFADEVLIITQVYRWAATKLSNMTKTMNQENVREILGQIYTCLRFSELTPEQFLDFERTSGIHTRQECLDITRSLMKDNTHSKNLSQDKCRVRKTFNCSIEHPPQRLVFWSNSCLSTINFNTRITVAITDFSIYFIDYGIHYDTGLGQSTGGIDGSLPLNMEFKCKQSNFEQKKTVSVQNGKEVSVKLDPPLMLTGSGTETYSIIITACCSLIPKLRFRTKTLGTVIIPTEIQNSLAVKLGGTTFIAGFELSRLSGRDSADGQI